MGVISRDGSKYVPLKTIKCLGQNDLRVIKEHDGVQKLLKKQDSRCVCSKNSKHPLLLS